MTNRVEWPAAIVGPSLLARRLREAFARAVRPQSRTLITAAPGMGGHAVARAIHRSDGVAPFVEVDCAATDPVKVEAQLLGRATKISNGDLEHVDAGAALVAARDGTCVLHGVEELSHRAQARLARVLRDGEVRVRTAGDVPLRCRLIAIGHATLDSGAESGQLRTDLLRRLAAVRLELAPLNERREDIADIVAALMARAATERQAAPRTFTHAAMALVSALQWPDNVAGLTALVDAVADGGPDPVRVEEVLGHLGAPGHSMIAPHATLREARRQFEREYIAAMLRRFDGRMAPAAEALGIQRTNLYRKARQLGMHSRKR